MNEEIIDWFLNLILTIIIYELVPFILKIIWRQQYTEKQAKKIAIINSLTIYMLFFLYTFIEQETQVPNVAAAFIWGTVAYYWLRNKNIEPSSNTDPETDLLIEKIKDSKKNDTEHASTNKADENRAMNWQEFLKKNSINSGTGETIQDVKIQNKQITTDAKESKSCFSKKFVVILVLIIILIVGIIDYYFYIDFNDKYVLLQQENEQYSEKIDKLQKENDELNRFDMDKFAENIEKQKKLDFMDSYVVIVPSNTNIYHKYDCQYCDKSSGLIFNVENAKAEGYVPCKHCIN